MVLGQRLKGDPDDHFLGCIIESRWHNHRSWAEQLKNRPKKMTMMMVTNDPEWEYTFSAASTSPLWAE